MKNEMNEIPTPESDNCYHECVLTPSPGNGLVMRSKMRDLQRRLTIAREALDKLARLGNEPNFGYSEGNIIAFNALART